jgi:hypothetical protein
MALAQGSQTDDPPATNLEGNKEMPTCVRLASCRVFLNELRLPSGTAYGNPLILNKMVSIIFATVAAAKAVLDHQRFLMLLNR